jgi:hypothetical protein
MSHDVSFFISLKGLLLLHNRQPRSQTLKNRRDESAAAAAHVSQSESPPDAAGPATLSTQ